MRPPTRPAAKAFITSFGQRAFRRPLTDAEVTTHVGLFNQGPTLYPGVDAFKAGASLVIQAMLQSPYFLYRTELGTAAAGAAKVPLNDWEVAAKLAFALTNTMPDDTLFAAAAAGQLHDKASVAAQAKRLLDGSARARPASTTSSSRSSASDATTASPATRRCSPISRPNSPAAMKQEVLQFLDWIFAQGTRDQGLLHDARRVRGFAARAALWRDRQLLERPGHADEGRPRSHPAVGPAHAGGLPVVLHLGGQRAGHHSPRRVHRHAAPVQDAAAARPKAAGR